MTCPLLVKEGILESDKEPEKNKETMSLFSNFANPGDAHASAFWTRTAKSAPGKDGFLCLDREIHKL